ncbi:hypothetical protein [Corynebacterium neomassiliense]|uniref:hypothetical protein n=1 Tax=Corynebacterium neomassiliense TaxID=2079482 RepID=UPI0010322093|nr:hypothetical protein [Corynebacterium neomassiliense]
METLEGYTESDLNSPHFCRNGGYRSVPGYPHIHVLADGTEVWDAKKEKALSIRLNYAGYPVVKFGGRQWRVQRLVLAAWYPGCLDDGSMALHKVPKRDYVAVWNLRPGSAADNSADMVRDGNHHQSRKTLCPAGHPLVGENLRSSELVHGKRACRACDNARTKISDAKRKGVDIANRVQRIADAYADRYLADTFLPLPLTPVDVLQRRVDAVTSVEWRD